MDKLEGIQYPETMSVSTEEVSETISKLKKGSLVDPMVSVLKHSRLLIAKCMYCYHCVIPYAWLMIYHNLWLNLMYIVKFVFLTCMVCIFVCCFLYCNLLHLTKVEGLLLLLPFLYIHTCVIFNKCIQTLKPTIVPIKKKTKLVTF